MSSELIDHEAVRRWLDAQRLGTGLSLTVESLSNGRSNVMFSVSRGDQRWVLRRPRKVAVDRADDLMRREFRLLAALSATDVPHARAVALCDDVSVLGCVLYLMTHVEGFNPAGPLPARMEGRQEQVAHAMIDALVTLHQADWRAIGLADFGRPDGFHQRQVSRWLGQLNSHGGRDMPELHGVASWLNEHAPSDFEPAIMHGDYHVLNVIVAPDTPVRVAAIVDWETTTIGDPVLNVYRQACPSELGWPDADGLRQRYAEATGDNSVAADSATMSYYVALYNFRMAILMEGIYQRSLKDAARGSAQDVAQQVSICVDRAVAATEQSKSVR
jgi:aminoglycoside phosphotransferase (APT) family kinase protein